MGSEAKAIPPSMMEHLPRSRVIKTVISQPSSSIEAKIKELRVSELFQFEEKDPSRRLLPNQPTRFDAELASCVVRGAVPTSIDGTYYRIVIEPIFANRNKQDIWINGDGSVHAWRFSNGVVDFRQKFVRTPRFIIERTARQPLWGTYRNPYAGDPRVFDEIQSTGNTHVQFWRGKLLVLKEDSPPLILDPDTLDTFGSNFLLPQEYRYSTTRS
jgi:carotenoid cleavage dioxygenase